MFPTKSCFVRGYLAIPPVELPRNPALLAGCQRRIGFKNHCPCIEEVLRG